MITMSMTRYSILERVRDLNDAEGWCEFDLIYRPLIFGYLRGLGVEPFDADELTQEVFRRLMKILPTFELNRKRARFRTYLWKLTHNSFLDWVRRRKVRSRAEEEWRRQFCDVDNSGSREMEDDWIRRHRERILEVVLPRVREMVSPTAWRCFEQRLLRGRPAAAIAAEMGISGNVVYVYASRVLKQVRRLCAELEEGQGDEPDYDLS